MGSEIRMGELTRIKKMSAVYDLLSDLNEYKLCEAIERIMKKEGYKVCVVGNKYKFKYHTDKCR